MHLEHIFTGLLVLSSFLTLGAICFQAVIYKHQLTEMRKTSKLASEGVFLSRLDQRAWVSTYGAATLSMELNKPLTATINIKNTGKTFARGMTLSQVLQILPKGELPDFPRQDRREEIEGVSSDTLLPPGGEFEATVGLSKPLILSQSDIDAINAGDKFIVMFGKISYRDIFKCEHWTTFCLIYVPGPNTFNAYSANNDADDNRSPMDCT